MRFRTAMILNSLSSLALPLAAVVTGPLLARALGPEGRGVVAAVLVPSLLAVGIANLGLPTAVLYFCTRSSRAGSWLRTAVLLSLACGAVAVAALWLVEPILIDEQTGPARYLYYAVAATVPLGMLVELMRSYAQARGVYALPVVERTSAASLRILAIAGLFVVGALGIEAAVWASWMPGVLVGLVYLALLARARVPDAADPAAVANLASSGPPFRLSPGRSLLPYALRAWGGNVAGMLILRVDQVLLITLVSRTELGLYVVAVAVAEVPIMAVSGVRDLVMARSSGTDDAADLARTSRVVVLVCTAGCLLIALCVPVALPLVFGRDFSGAVVPTLILLGASILNGACIAVGVGLSSRGRPGRFSVAQLVAVPVSALLLLLLAPALGGVGAALASAAAYATVLVISARALNHHQGLAPREILVPRRSDFALLRGLASRRTTGRAQPAQGQESQEP